jgi:hypothetical protein
MSPKRKRLPSNQRRELERRGVPPHKMPELFADACRTITNARTQRNATTTSPPLQERARVFGARKMETEKMKQEKKIFYPPVYF